MPLNLDQITKLIKSLDRETKAIKQELFKLCWYMRGGLTITEAYQLSIDEREMIVNLVEENLAITKESGLPFF